MFKRIHKVPTAILVAIFLISCGEKTDKHREIISLNGTWEIAESFNKTKPVQYNHTIPVPGLVDLAEPKFDSTGLENDLRNYFWYRKTVSIPTDENELVFLKVNKAKFGQRVYVNDQYAGEYNYNFTPGLFEISDLVDFGKKNEIVIRIEASPEVLPDTIPWGEDVEKWKYFSGIYDNVELILTDYPYIKNIHIVPDIQNEKIKVIALVDNGPQQKEFEVAYSVSEKETNNIVVEGNLKRVSPDKNEETEIEFEIDIPESKLWSPEDPFLYQLQVSTPGDSKTETFGMREFHFDPETKLAMLNGKPYYLRGTNIALHRFFEDSVRQNLPWDKNWISNLHDTLKAMNWNSYRFHVGFAPEIWYEIADEKGFLVQDEYAIWGIFSKDTLRHMASTLIPEYKTWIKERRNHPSVIVWDAQNETVWRETGKVIDSVRSLDLSNRPWDNGFSPPQKQTDMIESHPYLFSKVTEMPEEGLLKAKLGSEPEPFNDPNTRSPKEDGTKYDNPVIVNEYGWIWLYRNGMPAKVAEKIWRLYPEFNTPEKRWDWRGRVIAAMTEYWRSRRDIAGVQHFCVLTCDRTEEPRSQVSDEWEDVENLILHPGFKKYVKSAFSPVGLMIKFWNRELDASKQIKIPVVLINDLRENWSGEVKLKLFRENEIVSEQAIQSEVKSLQINEIIFEIKLPEAPGNYELVAELHNNEKRAFSSRLFKIK